MTALITLVFNPTFWIVIAITGFASFSGGVVLGWGSSQAEHWKNQAEALQEASESKEAQIAADGRRATDDLAEAARRNDELQKILNEMRNAQNVQNAPVSCRLTDAEQRSLRALASSSGRSPR